MQIDGSAFTQIDLKFICKALNKIYPDPNFAVAEDIKSAFNAIAKVRDSEKHLSLECTYKFFKVYCRFLNFRVRKS